MAVLPPLLLAGAPILREVSVPALRWSWVALGVLGVVSASYHLVGLSVVLFGIGAAVGFVLLTILGLIVAVFILGVLLSG